MNNEHEIKGNFKVEDFNKDDITFEGVTENFVWYEATQLRAAMSAWGYRFEKLVSVMEARHKENNLILSQVMLENNQLKAELKQIKGESK